MAGKENEGDSNNWWDTWINTAKNKTSTVLEAVKKDLGELSSAVRHEASSVGAAIENTFKVNEEESAVETVKKSLSSFFGQVTDALIPSPEDDDAEAILITSQGTLNLTGFRKHLVELQRNDKTYLEEPQKELIQTYERWMDATEQDQFTQNRLAKLLASSEILNEKYLSLVPEKIPHMDFWKRYLFKRALLEDAYANAEIAERQANSKINSNKPVSPKKIIVQTQQPQLVYSESEENNKKPEKKALSSDDGDWVAEEIPSTIELSEEEQIRLLEQYEQEIQEREKRKSVNLSQESENDSNKSLAEQLLIKEKKVIKYETNQTSEGTTDHPNKSPPSPKSLKTEMTQENIERNMKKLHFNVEETSSTSEESWEKDFDISE